MSSIIQCDKCGNLMKIFDGGENTLYRCPKCGYSYLAGFRFNKLTEQNVKFVKVL